MRKTLIWLWVVLPLLTWSQSNSPYQLNPALDASLLSAGLGISVTGFVLDRTTTPLTEAEVLALDVNEVPRFDRYSTRQKSSVAASFSDILFYGGGAAPLALFAGKNERRDWLIIGTMWAESFLLTTGATLTTKGTTLRTRPFAYNSDFPLDDKLTTSTRHSFFSGHTSTAASGCFFAAKVWSDYHPDSKWKPLVWTAAALTPATVAFLRVQSGKHYPTDVITGYAAGALIGWAVPMLHRKKDSKVSVVPFSGQWQGVTVGIEF